MPHKQKKILIPLMPHQIYFKKMVFVPIYAMLVLMQLCSHSALRMNIFHTNIIFSHPDTIMHCWEVLFRWSDKLAHQIMKLDTGGGMMSFMGDKQPAHHGWNTLGIIKGTGKTLNKIESLTSNY